MTNKYLQGLSTTVTVDPDAAASWLKLGFFENLKERKSPRALGLGLSLSVEEFIWKHSKTILSYWMWNLKKNKYIYVYNGLQTFELYAYGVGRNSMNQL